MASLTKDQGFPASSRHNLDPPGFFSPVVGIEIFECSNVMHLDLVGHVGCPTDFADLGKESFFQFRSTVPGELVRSVPDGVNHVCQVALGHFP